jgi:hypothetical protein
MIEKYIETRVPKLFGVISLLLAFGLVSVDVNGQQKANKEGNPILFEENFEKEEKLIGLHKQFATPHAFEVVTTPVYEGKYSGKFELRYGDPRSTKSGRRSEILFPEINEKERWYGFSVFFPSDGYQDDEDSEIITQWHNCCGTPTLSLRNTNGRLNLRVGNDRRLKGRYWNNFDFGPVPKDQWMRFVFHIIHADGEEGLVEVWRDGEKLVSHQGPNMEIGNDLPRWKLGIYKSTWDEKATKVSLRKIYFDFIKLAGPTGSLEKLK